MNHSTRWLPPVAFAVTFMVLYFAAMPLFNDPDVPWHLATGKLLLATHHLPATDPWSFASGGAPWYNLAWLWDIKIAIIEKIAGTFGVFIFTVYCAAVLLAFLAWIILRRDTALPVALLVLFIATLCMLEMTTTRPHLAGYGFLLIFACLLHENRARSDYRMLMFLPPLMLLWVNVHGSFLAGFTVLIAHMLEALFAKNNARLKHLVVITIACGVCTLANPYGIDIYGGAMRSLDSVTRAFIAEWQPLSFTKSIGLSVWFLAFVLAFKFRSKVPLADQLLAYFWAVAAAMAARNGLVFVLLSAPYIAGCIDEKTRARQAPVRIPAWLEGTPVPRLWIVSVAIAAAFTALMANLPHEGRLQSPTNSAQDAIDFAMQHYPTHHFLTDYNLGGQVIYFSDGKLPMFMDSRAGTAYSEQALNDYVDFLFLRPGWEKKITAYGVNAILLGNRQDFAKSYDNGQYRDKWKLVFAGTAANVYISAPR